MISQLSAIKYKYTRDRRLGLFGYVRQIINYVQVHQLTGSSSSSRNEYYSGGIIALLLALLYPHKTNYMI